MKRRAFVGGALDEVDSGVVEVMARAERVAVERATAAIEGEAIVQVPVDRITRSPYQRRKHFDPAELDALASNIREFGLQQHPTVRPLPGGDWELVFGERRWRAVRLLGWDTIPVRVREISDWDALLIGVHENRLRADLSEWEECCGVADTRDAARREGQPATNQALSAVYHRNVAIINHQLQIAEALGPDVIASWGIPVADLALLKREPLLRVAKAPASARRRELTEAIRKKKESLEQARRRSAPPEPAEGRRQGKRVVLSASAPPASDRFRDLWDGRSGLHVNIRGAVSDMKEKQARAHAESLAVGFACVAERLIGTGEGEGTTAGMVQEAGPGRLLYLRAPDKLGKAEREAQLRLLDELRESLVR